MEERGRDCAITWEEKDAPSDEDGEVSLSEGEKEERVGN
jgi:hypothetical protein